MIQKVFAIRDDKVEAFMNPICFVTRGQAMRWFTDVVHQADSEIGKHPEDYKLMQLGEYDSAHGIIVGDLNGPQLVCSGFDVMSTERGGL